MDGLIFFFGCFKVITYLDMECFLTWKLQCDYQWLFLFPCSRCTGTGPVMKQD
jgi:hypothetical protein